VSDRASAGVYEDLGGPEVLVRVRVWVRVRVRVRAS